MTRSGGLWPSAKVLMLMMTFSPMSIRPSMWPKTCAGSSTTLRRALSRGFTLGRSRTRRARPLQSPCFERGSALPRPHFAAGRSPDRFRLHQLDAAGAICVVGRRCGAVDGDDVHPRQHLVEVSQYVASALPPRHAPACGCDSGSGGPGAPGAAVPIRPMPVMPAACRRCAAPASGSAPAGELARLYGGDPINNAAGRGDQRHRHVGGVFGEYARRLVTCAAETVTRYCLPLPRTGDEPQTVPAPGQRAAIDLVGDGRHQHVAALLHPPLPIVIGVSC